VTPLDSVLALVTERHTNRQKDLAHEFDALCDAAHREMS
jgi:hypothetical protein